MLARLNAQNDQLGAARERGQELMSNFDTDRAIHSGSEVAYRNGKALLQQGRQQLETMVGAETVAGLHMAAPLLARAGRGVQGGYQLYQTAQAAQHTAVLNARQSGVAKGVAARARRFDGGEAPAEAPAAAPAEDGGLPDVIAQPLAKARGYFGQIQARGDDGPSPSFLTDTSRNLRFNPATGGVDTDSGAPATFGEERLAQFRTPLEEQAFENPNVNQRPVGIPADRVDYGNVDLSSAAARSRANTAYSQETEQIQRQRAQTLPSQQTSKAPDPLEGNLPDRFNLPTPAEIQSGARAGADPQTAGLRPRAQTIGEQRPIEPQVQPQSAPSYRRPGTQYNVRAQQPKPINEDVSDPQGITRLGNIAEKYGARPEVQAGLAREAAIPPAPQGAAPDLSSDTSLQRPTSTVDARTLNFPDIPSNPVGAPAVKTSALEDDQAASSMLGVEPSTGLEGSVARAPGATTSAFPKLPDSLSYDDNLPKAPTAPVNYAVDGAKIGGVDNGGGIPGVKFPGQAAADAGNDTSRVGQPASMNPAADAAARQDAANAADPAYQAQLRATLPKAPAPAPTGQSNPGTGGPKSSGPASAAEGAEGAEGAAEGAADVGAEVAGEALAAAIPGVGEILGGILGIGSLLFGAHEESKTPVPPPPPKQPQGIPSTGIAFDSAPVFDSSDYHAL